MLFSSNIWAPPKKPVCLLVLLSLWCSCCPCPRSLCACRHHGNPGKPRKPSRNNRNKQKTQENPGNQAETTETSRKPRKPDRTNPGKRRNQAEKKHCNSIESFKYEQSVFCLPSYPPLPPPGALSRNGGALSLNNVFPARLFGKHGRKTLSLNSLLSAEKLENHFQVAPKLQKQ